MPPPLCYPSSPSPPLFTWCLRYTFNGGRNPAPPSITISLSYFSFVRYITFLHAASHPCDISPSSYTISRTTSRLCDIFSPLYILFHILLHIRMIYHRPPYYFTSAWYITASLHYFASVWHIFPSIRVIDNSSHPCDVYFFSSMWYLLPLSMWSIFLLVYLLDTYISIHIYISSRQCDIYICYFSSVWYISSPSCDVYFFSSSMWYMPTCYLRGPIPNLCWLSILYSRDTTLLLPLPRKIRSPPDFPLS